MLYLLVSVLVLIALTVYAFTLRRDFGKRPSGDALQALRASRNYRNGQFHNLSPTPNLAADANFFSVLRDFFLKRSDRSKPAERLPSQKTSLRQLDPDENCLVWFGHSSYFLQMDKLKILVDPVFSGSASPLPSGTKSYAGSDVFSCDDLPDLDVLLLTHDHWDHLDYKTVLGLRSKAKRVVTTLGTGAHLRAWGFAPEVISELDWYDSFEVGGQITLTATPARHFSGRGLKRNTSLWASFVLHTPARQLFLGGDSGYDAHFAEIGRRFGPFDLAILECGQYNTNWPFIHLLPHEEMRAAQDLRARAVLPVHWGKFSLALHAWDEPIRAISRNAASAGMPLWTPMIGEKVNLDAPGPFRSWWEEVR